MEVFPVTSIREIVKIELLTDRILKMASFMVRRSLLAPKRAIGVKS